MKRLERADDARKIPRRNPAASYQRLVRFNNRLGEHVLWWNRVRLVAASFVSSIKG